MCIFREAALDSLDCVRVDSQVLVPQFYDWSLLPAALQHHLTKVGFETNGLANVAGCSRSDHGKYANVECKYLLLKHQATDRPFRIRKLHLDEVALHGHHLAMWLDWIWLRMESIYHLIKKYLKNNLKK